MKIYTVKITEDAQNDMSSIYDGILHLTKSPGIAMKQYNMLAEAIASLEMFPERTPKIVIDADEEFVLHRLVVGKYTVFYCISEYEVTVTNVLYSSSSLVFKLL